MLDNRQKGAIKQAQKKAGLNDQEYRKLLFEVAGVTSSRYLSDDGFQAVLHEIKGRIFEYEKTPQEKMIWGLWLGSDRYPGICQYIPAKERTKAYLFGFISRRLGRSDWKDLPDLSKVEKRDVIDALRDRLAQEIAKANRQQTVPF